ncbi:MAG: 3-isopropylmalate dehydratase small subunit [Acidobacteria bacterium]|jgi:3-isopropylmalate/(R)-2-methylmalate dehydratase small subunit|nr:MAG: 3-isopropylmalate dehydratase small subunit [Acidobacteriota bacterium]GIU82419.1 MAG: 3-isopropylmalate dehydratase small subunit [Pyrinomonadaceae bacterium]
MQKFIKHKGKAVAIFQPNIDTDQILPKQFLKRIDKTGFGNFLFYDWRFDENGNPNPEFILNQERYKDASILIAGKNFGSGSSREHAPWALFDYGFRAILAPSFGEIFYNNSFNVGLLLVTLPEGIIKTLVEKTETLEHYELEIDLQTKQISDDFGFNESFEIDEFKREKLLKGLDDISFILQFQDQISEYESKRPLWMPKVL